MIIVLHIHQRICIKIVQLSTILTFKSLLIGFIFDHYNIDINFKLFIV